MIIGGIIELWKRKNKKKAEGNVITETASMNRSLKIE
jgi:hypothetical protein